MMYAYCVECPKSLSCTSADEAEVWAAEHEQLPGKHSVKVEGYEQYSA